MGDSDLRDDGPSTLTTLRESGVELQLHIEAHTPTPELDWSETLSILTDSYEIGAKGTPFEEDLHHNIQNVDGKVFRLPESEVEGDTKELSFVCLLTKRGDDGEILIPDDPFDKGTFRIPAGTYRVYETRRL